MKIKENKTRISLWLNNKRFAKIEINKLIITSGYSRHDRVLWCTFKFNNIDDCLNLLRLYLLQKRNKMSVNEENYIQNLYLTY
jgi:hypothetical protein